MPIFEYRCNECGHVTEFLEKAGAKSLTVVYSLTSRGTPETILPGMRPLGTEPVVKSSVDKFYSTDLEKILRERGIAAVIIALSAFV